MTIQRVLREFPLRRISARDGMAVTAEVWREAHSYHRLRARFQALMGRGPGIAAGLEVIASDPPDSTVYILPGIAVDTGGQTIVLPEPTAYDLGASQGVLHLLLTYAESPPSPSEAQADGPDYVDAAFSVEARPDLPGTPYVELARVRREGRGAAVTDPGDPMRPGPNEIDMRFRLAMGAAPSEPAAIAVCRVGRRANGEAGHGLPQLARALRHAGVQAWVDDSVPLDDRLSGYALVCMVAGGAFKLERDEMTAVYDYVQQGGTLLFEACRAEEGADEADAAFVDLLGSMGIELSAVASGQRLLSEPHLFPVAPDGYETEGKQRLLAGGGVIHSKADYGCLWRGTRRGGHATREQVRTGVEWGENVLFDALARRREHGS